MWTELPLEVLTYILEKISDLDLNTFLAASAVCKHWRCSSSLVSSISLETYLVNCKKHHNYCFKCSYLVNCKKHHSYFFECSCFSDCIQSVLARSKSVSKLRIDFDLVIDRSIVCDVLGKCNWLGTLQELHMRFGKVWSCSSLSVFDWIAQDLILTNLKSLTIITGYSSNETIITGYSSNEAIQLLMERVANLEYLSLSCDDWYTTPVVINAPASVVRMELTFTLAGNLLVNAAGVKDMFIDAIRVELETPLLEELTLHFGTQSIRGSPAVRRLHMCLNEDCSHNNIVSTLSSCVALSGIKTLCRSPGLTHRDSEEDNYIENSGMFFDVMSKLTELEELELNFNMVMQLSPEGNEVTVFLPKLKTLAFDCSGCVLDYNYYFAKREDSLIEKFQTAWEYLKSVTPRAQVVIRNEHCSSLTKKVDLLQHTSTCTE